MHRDIALRCGLREDHFSAEEEKERMGYESLVGRESLQEKTRERSDGMRGPACLDL